MFLFGILLFPELLACLMKHEKLSFHFLHPYILDSGDSRIEPVLEWLVPHLNHLTIYTKQIEKWEPWQETIQQEYGLLVELINRNVLSYENLIIDFAGDVTWDTVYASYTGPILDMRPNSSKMKQYTNYMKHASYYCGLSLHSEQPFASLIELQEHLQNTEEAFDRLVEGTQTVWSNELENIRKQEGISLLTIKKRRKF